MRLTIQTFAKQETFRPILAGAELREVLSRYYDHYCVSGLTFSEKKFISFGDTKLFSIGHPVRKKT